MKRKIIILAVTAMLLLLVAAYFWGPSSVPAGQPQLLTFNSANFSEFETTFDRNSDTSRLVLLLSPT
jgi:hypothetical protein